METVSFPLMGFLRHRLGVDGQGVTTLAAAWGCPLRCRYCLNPQCTQPETRVRPVTPEELFEMARADDLYFRATGGGVTFGGGEPLAHAAFIRAFCALCPDWHITAETCLNIPAENLRTVLGCVHEYLVDIKDMDPDLYRRYTGQDNAAVIRNLRTLLDAVGPERVKVRIPHIPDFNTGEDVARSADALKAMGFTRLDIFTYRKSGDESPPS